MDLSSNTCLYRYQDAYDGEFDFAAKSKLTKNNLYLREN